MGPLAIRRHARRVALASLISAGLISLPAQATDYYWTSSSGGLFIGAPLWSPFSPPNSFGPGGALDDVHFALGLFNAPNPYTVTDVLGQNDALIVDSDSVTLSFGGDYTLNNTGVASPSLSVGYTAGLTPNVVLQGNGSSVFRTQSSSIGFQPGAVATVTAKNLQWISAGTIFLGDSGIGQINIQNSSTLSAAGGIQIGDFLGSTGTLNVTGAGSTFNNTGTTYVGQSGTAYLNVTAGGAATTADVLVGGVNSSAGSSIGTATVTGAGSVWNANNLYVGGSASLIGGTGTVNITNQGVLNVSGTTRIWTHGTVNLDGGTLKVPALVNSGGVFHWSAGTLHVTGSAGLEIGAPGFFSSSLLLSSPQTLQVDQALKVDAGTTLFADGALSAGSVTIASGGQLYSSGPNPAFGTGATNHGDLVFAVPTTLTGPVTNAADGRITTLSPVTFTGPVTSPGNFYGAGKVTFAGGLSTGASPATVTFEGPVGLLSSNALQVQLAGTAAGQFDQLDIAGGFDLAGALNVSLLNGFHLQPNEQFLIADITGTQTGQFTNLNEGSRVGTFAGTDLFITYHAGTGNDVALFTAVPEPTTVGLLAITGVLFNSRRRRRKSQR